MLRFVGCLVQATHRHDAAASDPFSNDQAGSDPGTSSGLPAAEQHTTKKSRKRAAEAADGLAAASSQLQVSFLLSCCAPAQS